MKISNMQEVLDFLATVRECVGTVYLKSPFGDTYNLKSGLSQYIAIAALLREHGDTLELFCENYEDESRFYKFFNEHPEVIE